MCYKQYFALNASILLSVSMNLLAEFREVAALFLQNFLAEVLVKERKTICSTFNLGWLGDSTLYHVVVCQLCSN